MKVVFTKDIKGVGKKGEVKEINDGYARNFLILKGFAVQATSGAIQKIEKEKSEKDAAYQRKIQTLKKLADSIKNLKLHFTLKAGEKGELFGSITSKDIEKQLVQYKAGEAQALLEHPIKSIGEHVVPINVGEGIETTIVVDVKKE
ncbi:50S ribosomal protein L9 [Candidatus Parcubacteria bacterium]|jgi:large subunit ribosomal protein L9|nr:MAG: 50S ribosomal protein L9 [Candidatus Parcubacteria bacterium]